MKSIRYSWLITICAFIFISCKKDPLTRRVEFNSTTYNTLGTFDNTGKPTYLASPDVISDSLRTFIDTLLLEQRNLSLVHPELLSSPKIADIKITTESDVYVTFISQGTMYTNTFAFYTYPSNSSPASTADIKTITYVFPNAGDQTTLHEGDKVKIGRFSPGTSIGFVLLKDAWDITAHTINSKAVHFCSNDVLNPEIDVKLKKHAVLIDYPAENKVIVGFEDRDRTESLCDNDFNDMVLYCTVTP